MSQRKKRQKAVNQSYSLTVKLMLRVIVMMQSDDDDDCDDDSIPDICHERHEYIRVNFFWPV